MRRFVLVPALLALCVSIPAIALSATPIMFQHIASSTNPTGNGIPGHAFVFHTERLPAHATAVMGVTVAHGITVTMSDTLVGAWSAPICGQDAGTGLAKTYLFVQPLGAAGGADTITLGVGSSNTQPVQFDLTVFENIATSSPANGSLCPGGGNLMANSSGVVDPGSFTPTTNNTANGGNVIWNYTPICSTNAAWNARQFKAASGFTLLNGDIIWSTDQGFPEASQYYVQTAQASVTPSITATGENASGDCFNSVSVALKIANLGATAAKTIHVAKIIHESFITFSSPGRQLVQFPTAGNLRIAAFTWPGGCPGDGAGCVSGLSSSDGCAWKLAGGTGGDAVIAYAQNCLPCPTCTVTLNWSGNQMLPQASFRLYDVQNAKASSYQNSAGDEGSCGTSVAGAPMITPRGASSGLVIAALGNGNGPVTSIKGPTGSVFDLWTFAAQTDSDLADNADASSHVYFSSTAAQDWVYTKTHGNDECYWEAATFD